jgi:hypothetical protein
VEEFLAARRALGYVHFLSVKALNPLLEYLRQAGAAPLPVTMVDLPRAFRTADLWLIHAADCRSRYSSRTCRGVRY